VVDYYKSQWHNCNRCRIHFTSEEPHLKAYLCDECWTTLPHYSVKHMTKKKQIKKEEDYSIGQIVLYTLGNLLCLGVIAYYLWFK
jgi:hypothetical protein